MRVLFSRNYTYGKFRKNKTLVKISEFLVIRCNVYSVQILDGKFIYKKLSTRFCKRIVMENALIESLKEFVELFVVVEKVSR